MYTTSQLHWNRRAHTSFERLRKQHIMGDAIVANPGVTLIAKWGKERIVLEGLNGETTIENVKELLEDRTGVLAKRQKLIGLTAIGAGKVTDELMICDLKVKSGKTQDGFSGVVHSFIMMGSREEHIFVDPSEKDDLPDVIDDFDLDFNAGSSEVSKASIHLCVWFPRAALISSHRTRPLIVASACGQRGKSQEVYRTHYCPHHERAP